MARRDMPWFSEDRPGPEAPPYHPDDRTTRDDLPRYRDDRPEGPPWYPHDRPSRLVVPDDHPASHAWRLLLVPMVLGSLVALTLGVYGSLHDGTGIGISLAGFQNHPAPTSAAKVTLSTGAVAFALLQIISALIMYGKVPIRAPGWLGGAHRWSGRLAFLLAVPVAVHCLYAAGFQTFNSRVFLHSLLGCLFFGAFTVKMLGLRKDGIPGWALPVIGGVVFTGLIGVWWTTAIRFFQTFGSPL